MSKVKKEFVEQHGIRQQTAPAPAPVVPATTTTTTTEDPLLEQFLASADSGPSGGNLINLVLNGHLDEAKQLIADGADVNSADQHGNRKTLYKLYP